MNSEGMGRDPLELSEPQLGKGSVDKVYKAELKDLHAKIGQLTLEVDFLERAFAREVPPSAEP